MRHQLVRRCRGGHSPPSYALARLREPCKARPAFTRTLVGRRAALLLCPSKNFPSPRAVFIAAQTFLKRAVGQFPIGVLIRQVGSLGHLGHSVEYSDDAVRKQIQYS